MMPWLVIIGVGVLLTLLARRSKTAPISKPSAPPSSPKEDSTYTDPRVLTENFPPTPPPFPAWQTTETDDKGNKRTSQYGPELWRVFALQYGNQYGVPAAVILAVIWTESTGRSNATNPSRAGFSQLQNASWGLMQIRAIAARDVDEESCFVFQYEPTENEIRAKLSYYYTGEFGGEPRVNSMPQSEIDQLRATARTQIIEAKAQSWFITDAGPLFPDNNIRIGAKYLRKLFEVYCKTGKWFDAAAAYNLGPTEWTRRAAAQLPLPATVETYATRVITRANLGSASRL